MASWAEPVHPHDYDPRWLPAPIPASYYARGEAPPPGVAGWPWQRVLTIGAVALAGAVLLGVVIHLATDRPQAVAQQLTPSPAATPSVTPSDQPTPFVAAPTDTPTATPAPTPTPSPTPTPTASPSAGSVVVGRLAPVRPGGTVTLVAMTTPRATCEITVGYSPPPPLAPKAANGQGIVTWSWQVGRQVQQGIYPIQVTCGSATGGTTLIVR